MFPFKIKNKKTPIYERSDKLNINKERFLIDELDNTLSNVREDLKGNPLTSPVFKNRKALPSIIRKQDGGFQKLQNILGGGGGTGDYNELSNKPRIANVELQNNKNINEFLSSADNTIIITENSIVVNGNIFYTKTQVDNLVAGISKTIITSTKPVNPTANTYYLVGNDEDGYVLYYYDTNLTEARVGEYDLDLTEYLKYTYCDNITIKWDDINKKISSIPIINVDSLPTENINDNVFYKLKDIVYKHNNNVIEEPIFYKNITEDLTINSSGITENETVISWENVTEEKVQEWITNNYIEESSKDDFDFANYNNLYDYKDSFSYYEVYSIYFRLNGDWKQIGENLGDIDYITMVINKPKINNVELTGNKTTAELLLSYSDLLNRPKINGILLDGNVFSENLSISYNDLTDVSKPKICNVMLVGNKNLTHLINSPDNTILIGTNTIKVNDTIFYTKTQVDDLVSGISKTYIRSNMPPIPEKNTYYLVGNDTDGYILYYYDAQLNVAKVGEYDLDLSDYIKHTNNLDTNTLSWNDATKKLSSKAIINVDELPTEDIKNCIYNCDGILQYYENEEWKKVGGASETDTFTITTGQVQYPITNKLNKTDIMVETKMNNTPIFINYVVSASYITFDVDGEIAEEFNGAVINVSYI